MSARSWFPVRIAREMRMCKARPLRAPVGTCARLEHWRPLGGGSSIPMFPQHDAKLPSSTYWNDVESRMPLTASDRNQLRVCVISALWRVSSGPFDRNRSSSLGLSIPSLLALTHFGQRTFCRLRLMGGRPSRHASFPRWSVVCLVSTAAPTPTPNVFQRQRQS